MISEGLAPDALSELARTWRRFEDDPAAALRVITETAVRAVEVARASIWLLDDDHRELRCVDLYQVETSQHRGGEVLHAAMFPAYFAALAAEEPIAAGDAHTDPRTAEFGAAYLTPNGIGAMLDAPIRLGGRLVGVLCHEHVGGARPWSREQRKDAAFLASLASLALELEQRGRREALLAATLESTGEGIVATDGERVVAYNRRFLEMWHLDGAPSWPFAAIRAHIATLTRTVPGFVSDANELLAGQWGDSTDVIELADGRFLERVSRPQVLRDQVVGRVWSFRDITGQRRAEAALRDSEARMRDLAIRDGLTGLFNRRHVVDAFAEAVNGGGRLAVALLDLDHFKDINDAHGHLVGDAVLRDFARVLRERLRGTDLIGRYGGEEFLVVLGGAAADGARAALAQVRAGLDAESNGRVGLPHYTFSAGIAELPHDGADITALLAAADLRLYEAKRSGRDRIV